MARIKNTAAISINPIAGQDFDADGDSDILLQHDDGTPAWLLMSGTTATVGGPGFNPGASWDAIGTGDFNRDGTADLLWQNQDGTPSIWLMKNGAPVTAAIAGYNPGSNWHAKGAGDFNADGKDDILWQNQDGTPSVWLMDGVTPTASAVAGYNPGVNWHIVGNADFNGDNRADILWQNDDGTPSIWLMNGTTPVSSFVVGYNPGANWKLKGASDFNGDGSSDLLWQNIDGTVSVWLMAGQTAYASTVIGPKDGNLQVQGAGDYNGDGRNDILLQNATTGQVTIWETNGTTLLSSFSVAAPAGGAAWHVVPRFTTAVNPINHAPVIDLDGSANGSGFAVTFTEGGPGAAIFNTDGSITDSDDANIESAVITLTNPKAGDAFGLGSLPAGISADTSVANQITLTGSATKADYRSALQAISFSSSGDNPSTATRTITITVTDGDLDSNTTATSVTVVAVNDAPTTGLSAIGLNEGATRSLATFLTSSDPDNTPSGVTYKISSLPANGTLKLNGADLAVDDTFTQAQVDSGAVSYTHSGSETTTDTFSYFLDDGDEDSSSPVLSTFTITVTPVNDAPTLDLDALANGTVYSTTFTTGGPGVAIADLDAVITDPDNTTIRADSGHV